MVIDDLLREQKISRYKLSKMSGVPQTTISDICNSKVDIENCNVSPMYKKVRVEENYLRIKYMTNIENYSSLHYHMEIINDLSEGGYVASYPDLPGCLTCGDTLEEVAKNADEAKIEWLLAAMEEGIDISEPSY